MGISGNIHEQVPENAVHHPERHFAVFGNLIKCDFNFVKSLVAPLIDTGCLTGRANERACKKVAQCGMVLPVGEKAA
ncbi:hypothetical protein D3C87_1672770 [compost metagenome]